VWPPHTEINETRNGESHYAQISYTELQQCLKSVWKVRIEINLRPKVKYGG
jgi:hypothetical protein